MIKKSFLIMVEEQKQYVCFESESMLLVMGLEGVVCRATFSVTELEPLR